MVLIWFKNGGSTLHFKNLIRFYDGVMILESNDVINDISKMNDDLGFNPKIKWQWHAQYVSYLSISRYRVLG